MIRGYLLAAAAAIAVTASASASAQLLGDSITGDYRYPDTATLYGSFSFSPSATFIVGAGSEATGFVDDFAVDVDFSDTVLVLTLPTVDFNDASFNGFVFTNNSGNFGPIQSSLGAVASLLAPNVLGINWAGRSYATGDTVTVTFAGGGVPEPTTWAMMIAGLGAVGLGMRRRRTTVSFA